MANKPSKYDCGLQAIVPPTTDSLPSGNLTGAENPPLAAHCGEALRHRPFSHCGIPRRRRGQGISGNTLSVYVGIFCSATACQKSCHPRPSAAQAARGEGDPGGHAVRTPQESAEAGAAAKRVSQPPGSPSLRACRASAFAEATADTEKLLTRRSLGVGGQPGMTQRVERMRSNDLRPCTTLVCVRTVSVIFTCQRTFA